MTTLAYRGPLYDDSRVFYSSATSADASRVGKQARMALVAFKGLDRRPLHDKLIALLQDCREVGWDGYDAKPIREDAVRTALVFALALPKTLPEPDITPDVDGEISFDWRGASDRLMSLSIAPSGRIAYAAVLGPDSRKTASDQFSGSIPKHVIETIQQVAS